MQGILPKSLRPPVHFLAAAGMCGGGRPTAGAGRRPRSLREEKPMAFVVTEPCVGCKYTDCVAACPAECFHEGERMLYINPDDCLDCEACVPECPVQAIFHES